VIVVEKLGTDRTFTNFHWGESGDRRDVAESALAGIAALVHVGSALELSKTTEPQLLPSLRYISARAGMRLVIICQFAMLLGAPFLARLSEPLFFITNKCENHHRHAISHARQW
jgi:hypothetical protein